MFLILAFIFLVMAPVEWLFGDGNVVPVWLVLAFLSAAVQGIVWRVR